MKKGDFIWGLILLIWVAILVVPASREIFIVATNAYPYLVGFIKFTILATMGDLLGVRILNGGYIIPKGLIYRATIWGIIGMMITLMFTVYMNGVAFAQTSGRLPFDGITLAQAFFGSTIMNLTFGPMMMVFHKFTDAYIDMRYKNKGGKVTINELVDQMNWHTIVTFSWLKICIFVWIPAHTMVFLLPEVYRVIVSAFLSIILGLILAIEKKGKHINNRENT